jgi:inner membrane protein
MDTLTHIALGACIGEVVAKKHLGKKGPIFGGIAQLIPDVDFIFGLWMTPAANAMAHRGITHSFIFCILATLVISLAFKRWWKNKSLPLRFWVVTFGVQIFVHVLLDSLNAYGTGWFEPFSHYRASFNTLFVADPFFSIPLGIACVILILIKTDNTKRYTVAVIGIGYCLFYLTYSVANKFTIESDVRRAFSKQHLPEGRYFTTPTPFNNWLWYVVSTNDDGSFVGYRSVFDKAEHIDFQFFPRNDSLLTNVENDREVVLLKQLSQGHYTVELNGDTLVFNDLRFGQMIGWKNPKAGFVFHYYLYPPLDNTLVLQRGRFANWDIDATKVLLTRIKGTK